MEVHGGADIHLQPMEDPTLEQVDVPKEGCDPVGSPCWSRFAGRTCDPTGRTHTGAACGGLYSLRGIPHWSSGRVSRKELQRQHVMN